MIFVVVPAFNEALNIKDLITSIDKVLSAKNFNYQFLIVNDGSTDDTINILQKLKNDYPLEIIDLEYNQGPGKAFSTAFLRLSEKAADDDIIVTIEADNTSDLKILCQMIDLIKNKDADLVLSSCYAEGGKVLGTNLFRISLSYICNKLVSALFRLKNIHTFSSFYRAVSVKTIKQALGVYNNNLITMNGFICMVEMLVKINIMNITIVEIPCILDCNNRLDKSKMKVLKTILSYFRFFYKFFIRNRNEISRIKKISKEP